MDSDGEPRAVVKPRIIEMQNMARASKVSCAPSTQIASTKSKEGPDSDQSDEDETNREIAINHLSSLNYNRTIWYSGIYTLVSVDVQDKPK